MLLRFIAWTISYSVISSIDVDVIFGYTDLIYCPLFFYKKKQQNIGLIHAVSISMACRQRTKPALIPRYKTDRATVGWGRRLRRTVRRVIDKNVASVNQTDTLTVSSTRSIDCRRRQTINIYKLASKPHIQVVKVIWHKAVSPPQTDGSVVFARWHQCALHGGTLAPPGEYDWICASFGPPESTTQTAFRSVNPFCMAH